VYIYLYKGDHFALENRFDALNIYAEQQAIELFPLNLQVYIKPLSCNHIPPGQIVPSNPAARAEHTLGKLAPGICAEPNTKVTIYNKRRERFAFEVYGRLYLERIEIDSVDSILPFGTPCLSERRRCCQVENATIEDPGVTQFNYTGEQKDDSCRQ